jgi:hypothetical protein
MYEALKSITSHDVTISVNVGPSMDAEGWIDLYIDSTICWGVEVVRESDKLSEHLDRLNNKYRPIANKSKKIINIDFVCQSSHTNIKLENRFKTFDLFKFSDKIEYYYICFDPTYTLYTIYYKAGGQPTYNQIKLNIKE